MALWSRASTKPPKSVPFDSDRVYLQLLRRRQKRNLLVDGIIACILALAIFNPVVPVLPAVLWAVLFPLFTVPRAFHIDSKRGILNDLLVSPVSTRAILRDLRRWVVGGEISLLVLFLLYGIIAIITVWIEDPRQLPETSIAAVVAFVLLPALWFFTMESSLIMAAFPNYPTMPYIVAIVWVVPVLLGVFWGGTYLFESTGAFDHIPPGAFFFPPHLLSLTYLALLIPPTWLAHMYAPWFMDQRRCGRWG